MNRVTVKESQQYLTVRHADHTQKIINVKRLLKRHPVDSILELLHTCFHEQERSLQQLVSQDKTDPTINETVATLFRIKMAITTLENGKEAQS